jgi:hypothetical protein
VDLTYQLYDITGNKIQAGKITGTAIDISGLKPGNVYTGYKPFE